MQAWEMVIYHEKNYTDKNGKNFISSAFHTG